jgi:hypothetical protein
MRVLVSFALVIGLVAVVGVVGATTVARGLPDTYCLASSDQCPGTLHPVTYEGEEIYFSDMNSVEYHGIGYIPPIGGVCIPGAPCGHDFNCGNYGGCVNGWCVCLAQP